MILKYLVEYQSLVRNESNQSYINFNIPRPLGCLHNVSKTYVVDNNKMIIAMFEYIEGYVSNSNTLAYTIGENLGLLDIALSQYPNDLNSIQSNLPSYLNLYNYHPHMNKQIFQVQYHIIVNDDHQSVNYVDSDLLYNEITVMEDFLSKHDLLLNSLPKQIIHGDYQYENILWIQHMITKEETISAVLDFEFCNYDLRIMDIATCLTKYVGDENDFTAIDDCIRGYCKHIKLTADEIYYIPYGIKLRILSRIIYYSGRIIHGQSPQSALRSRIATYSHKIKWINENASQIRESFYRYA
jgi:homoserine kinase type II